MAEAVNALYTDCPTCSAHMQLPQAASIVWETLFNRLLRDIHEGRNDDSIPDAETVAKTAAELKKAVKEGWANFDAPDWDTPDFGTISRLRENIFVFSGAKTLPMLKEISSMLTTEDGKVKAFSKFKADALAVWEQYNVNWLRTEYNHAIGSAQMAARWSEYDKNKDINPNLTYRTAGDDRVRAAHQMLDGVTKAIDDIFWDIYYPPNDWGCRCDAEAGDAKITTREFGRPELKSMFKTNVGKTGTIFPDTHPYFDQLAADSLKAIKKLKDTLMAEDYLKGAYKGQKGGKVDLHFLHKADEIQPNMKISKVLANEGDRIKLLPHTNQDGVKSPDASINGKIADFKLVSDKNSVSNGAKKASKQGSKILVLHTESNVDIDFGRQIKGAMNPNLNKNIEEVWLVRKGTVVKMKRADIWAGKWLKL